MKKVDVSRLIARVAARSALRTVAAASGLAITTVSRALNNSSDIALATRKRVRQVEDKSGYRSCSADG